jgi:hypothetical protein
MSKKAKEDQLPLRLVSERFRSNINAKMSISKERSKEKKEGLWVQCCDKNDVLMVLTGQAGSNCAHSNL